LAIWQVYEITAAIKIKGKEFIRWRVKIRHQDIPLE